MFYEGIYFRGTIKIEWTHKKIEWFYSLSNSWAVYENDRGCKKAKATKKSDSNFGTRVHLATTSFFFSLCRVNLDRVLA